MMKQHTLTTRIPAAVSVLMFSVLALATVAAMASEPVIEVNQSEKANPDRGEFVAPAATYSPGMTDPAADQSRLSPMMQEIMAVLERDRAVEQELESKIKMAPDEEVILKLQREIEALAQETELDILRVQLRFAREAGRIEAVDQLEKTIADILNPPVLGTRIDRPAPDGR